MIRAVAMGLVVLTGSLVDSPARADHFAIDLKVDAAKASQSVQAGSAAPSEKAKPRPVLELKAGERITVAWTLRSTATDSIKNVLVHFFVVPEEKVGQPTVPKLNREVAVETALTMDFKPRDKTQGGLTFAIDKPGSYLLRLETLGGGAGPGSAENYAALDLLVH